MTELLILVLAVCGFGLLALSLPRHQQEVVERRLTLKSGVMLRLGGSVALALGLAISVRSGGFGYGLVEALGLDSVGAALIVCALSLQRWRASEA